MASLSLAGDNYKNPGLKMFTDLFTIILKKCSHLLKLQHILGPQIFYSVLTGKIFVYGSSCNYLFFVGLIYLVASKRQDGMPSREKRE